MEIISRHMVQMAEAVLILICFHLLFFWKTYTNIFTRSTSEVVSTFFPHWIWMGRQLHRGKFPLRDSIYYQYPGSIPFLSSFYPFQIISSFLSVYFRLDTAFWLWQCMINLHYLLGSILAYILFSSWTSEPIALFGALTLTHAAFMIKIQPCVVYTVNWLPSTLLDGPLGMISVAGALLGGYWPYCVYFLPFSFMARLWWGGDIGWQVLGLVFALPQVITFLWYWPQSVRAKAITDRRFGAMPFHRLVNLIIPDRYSKYINGVLSQEMTLYIGIIPLLFIPFSQSSIWPVMLLALVGMMGWIPSVGRIPARWGHLFTFSLVWLAVSGMTSTELPWTASWALLLLQAFMLLINQRELSYWPFTEWWKKPSEFWKEKVSHYRPQFPYFTGYMDEVQTPGYTGGFALKRMHEKYGITDPNGKRVTEFL